MPGDNIQSITFVSPVWGLCLKTCHPQPPYAWTSTPCTAAARTPHTLLQFCYTTRSWRIKAAFQPCQETSTKLRNTSSVTTFIISLNTLPYWSTTEESGPDNTFDITLNVQTVKMQFNIKLNTERMLLHVLLLPTMMIHYTVYCILYTLNIVLLACNAVSGDYEYTQ